MRVFFYAKKQYVILLRLNITLGKCRSIRIKSSANEGEVAIKCQKCEQRSNGTTSKLTENEMLFL